MKKIVVLLILCGLLTGCGAKKYTCTYSSGGEDSKYTSTITFKVKKDLVTEAKAVLEFNDSATATSMCNIFKLSKDAENNLECDTKKIIVNNYHKSVSDEDMSYEEFVSYLKDQKFTCD